MRLNFFQMSDYASICTGGTNQNVREAVEKAFYDDAWPLEAQIAECIISRLRESAFDGDSVAVIDDYPGYHANLTKTWNNRISILRWSNEDCPSDKRLERTVEEHSRSYPGLCRIDYEINLTIGSPVYDSTNTKIINPVYKLRRWRYAKNRVKIFTVYRPKRAAKRGQENEKCTISRLTLQVFQDRKTRPGRFGGHPQAIQAQQRRLHRRRIRDRRGLPEGPGPDRRRKKRRQEGGARRGPGPRPRRFEEDVDFENCALATVNTNARKREKPPLHRTFWQNKLAEMI